MRCKRPGCRNEGAPTYCSRDCSPVAGLIDGSEPATDDEVQPGEVTARQLAEELKTSLPNIYQLTGQGVLPCRKLGPRKSLYDLETCRAAYLEHRKKKAPIQDLMVRAPEDEAEDAAGEVEVDLVEATLARAALSGVRSYRRVLLKAAEYAEMAGNEEVQIRLLSAYVRSKRMVTEVLDGFTQTRMGEIELAEAEA